jgi:hypothetical protein
MKQKNTYSIGPGALAEAGTDDGPGFTLSKPEWVTIQRYVTDSLALPITQDEFRNALGAGAPSDLSDFQKLIDAYAAVHGHVITWRDTTFPNTVRLASSVYEYGKTKVPVYYNAILKEADALTDNPNDAQAQKALKAILDNLQATANGYAAQAKDASAQVKQFADDTLTDQLALVGKDGKGGCLQYYGDKYGATSQDVQDLTNEVKAQRLVLDAANKEYEHDVIVAATTPAYAWLGLPGLIAASVVAGKYGKAAVDALNRAKAAQAKINQLEAKLAADANLMNALNASITGIQSISDDINNVLPVLQKIEGVWGGIADDLGAISKLIDTDIRDVLPVIMDLGVQEAIKDWSNIADKADAYRVNAYIQEQGGPSASMEAWRLHSIVTPRRRRWLAHAAV